MSPAAAPENPRFTAIGPGEHHLAVGAALPSVDASHVELASTVWDEVTDGSVSREGVSRELAVALGELLEACDVSYLCVIDERWRRASERVERKDAMGRIELRFDSSCDRRNRRVSKEATSTRAMREERARD